MAAREELFLRRIRRPFGGLSWNSTKTLQNGTLWRGRRRKQLARGAGIITATASWRHTVRSCVIGPEFSVSLGVQSAGWTDEDYAPYPSLSARGPKCVCSHVTVGGRSCRDGAPCDSDHPVPPPTR